MSGSSNLTISNSSAPQLCAHCDTALDASLKIAALVVIMVGALILNLLVIAVYVKNPSLHRTVNYFLVNMAVSDLLCPIVAIPKRLTMLITGVSFWHVKGTLGLALCKLQPLLQDLSPAVSTFTIICITVDRFYAVMRPLRTSMIPDKARFFIIALVWFLSILSYSPYFYVLKLVTHEGLVYCVMDWSPLDNLTSSTILTTYLSVLYGVLPWILVVILYIFIVVCLRRSETRIQANAQSLIQHRRTASVTRQAFVIVFVFAICSFPLAVLFLILTYSYKYNYPPLPYWQNLYFVAEFMLSANAALNPCICLFLNQNYRNGLWRLFRRNDRIHPADVVREEIPIENLTRST